MKINLIIIFMAGLVLAGCREEFFPEFKGDDKKLVIEGGITSEPGPYFIRLSQSLPINQPIRVPYTGCEVIISDDTGYQEILTEKEPGVYQTLENGITGRVGNSYAVQVKTPEGKIYQTDFQKMENPVGIDSIYAELNKKEDPEYPFGLPGYQFYINTRATTGGEAWFLWKMTETYEYRADYPLHALYYFGDYFYTDRNMVEIDQITGLNYDSLYTCWKTDPVKDIFTGKTGNLTYPQITGQPLHFVSTVTKKLSVRYSLLVKQYSIGEEAWSFWNRIGELISDETFLYTKQPWNIQGNLVSSEDPAEITFGYFTVASVTEKRIFVNRPNATFYFVPGYAGTDVSELHKKAQPVYLVLTEQGLAFVHKDCVDCRTGGGVVRKPDFWIN